MISNILCGNTNFITKKLIITVTKLSILESSIEKFFVQQIKSKITCFCLKLFIPGFTGLPDRVLFCKGGITIFVELKRPGQDLRPRQIFVKNQLEKLGFKYFKVDSKEIAKTVIDEIHAITTPDIRNK